MTTLGEWTPLRLLCFKHGTDRTTLARKAGLARQTLYNVEAGTLTWDTVHKIAEALGESPEYVRDVLEGRIGLSVEIREVAA